MGWGAWRMSLRSMAIPKLMGVETEYALVPSRNCQLSLHESCAKVIDSIAALFSGGDAVRYVPTRSQDNSHDLMLANGARVYIDLNHPEYSTPIVRNPVELLAADRAGEFILTTALAEAKDQCEELRGTNLYKDSVDRGGHSYACHENYLVSPELFRCLTEAHEVALKFWVPYMVTRPLFSGSGFFSLAEAGRQGVFVVSPRGLFIGRLVGLETQAGERSILNTRDRPYADPSRFRRLHVIVGEANRADYSLFLKAGVTQFVLCMLEAGAL